jgi:hypothetical protein
MMNEHEIATKAIQVLLNQVKKVGWTFTFYPVPPEERFIACYTLGFNRNYESHDLIIFGVAPEIANVIFNEAAEKLQNNKRLPFHEALDLGIGMSVMLKPITDPALMKEYMRLAWAMNGQTVFPAAQVVWPDSQGKYPWEDGFESAFHAIQPNLYKNTQQ